MVAVVLAAGQGSRFGADKRRSLWSAEKLATYLKRGHAEGAGAAGGPMDEAVEYGLQLLTDADIAAMMNCHGSIPTRTSSTRVVARRSPAMLASSTYKPRPPESSTHGVYSASEQQAQVAC